MNLSWQQWFLVAFYVLGILLRIADVGQKALENPDKTPRQRAIGRLLGVLISLGLIALVVTA